VDRLHALTISFTHHGGDTWAGHHRAIGLIDRIVNGQAALLAYEDIFFYTAALFVLSLPIILLLGGKTNAAAREVAAEAH
jgi:DHA2 family multidrug resistance protein